MKKKKCTKCSEVKSSDNFYTQKNRHNKIVLRAQCKDCMKEYGKVYNKLNVDKRRKYNRLWRKVINREKHLEGQRFRDNNRYKNNELYALKCRMRSRLNSALKGLGLKKENTTTQQIIGCSYEELKSHIEKQFTDGMSWDNRSEWHIDHIIPLDSANNKEELYKLSHYTNLQPLWEKDNLIKGKKLLRKS